MSANDLFSEIDAQAKELAEERAGIRQFDAGFDREAATRLGMLDSEEWRSACYVRHVRDMSDRQCLDFIEIVGKKQGDAAVARLTAALEPFARRRLIVDDVIRRQGAKAGQALIVDIQNYRGMQT